MAEKGRRGELDLIVAALANCVSHQVHNHAKSRSRALLLFSTTARVAVLDDGQLDDDGVKVD
jgi:hypothetical protein